MRQRVEITIVTVEKAGILGVLMVAIGSLGLIYKKSTITPHQTTGLVEVKLVTVGKLTCSDDDLIRAIDNIPDVDHVQANSFQGANRKLDEQLVSESVSNDEITPETVLLAEENLRLLIGPAAKFLVKQAMKKAKNVGDLFSILGNEVECSKDRAQFMSVV